MATDFFYFRPLFSDSHYVAPLRADLPDQEQVGDAEISDFFPTEGHILERVHGFMFPNHCLFRNAAGEEQLIKSRGFRLVALTSDPTRYDEIGEVTLLV